MYYVLDEKIIDVHDLIQVDNLYQSGYLLGRKQPGFMYKTRSLRIDLQKFSLSSENRRVLKKFSELLGVSVIELPVLEEDYNWRVQKLGKDFYSNKFSDVTFSALKIKQLLTENFIYNRLLTYHMQIPDESVKSLLEKSNGFAICYLGNSFLHYCYPFYDLSGSTDNLGMYMMLQAVIWAQMHGLKYIYLGGATRPGDKYKLQFSGIEWHDENTWQADLTELKQKIS